MTEGRVERQGPTREVLAQYLSRRGAAAILDLRAFADRGGAGRARITGMELLDREGTQPLDAIAFRQTFRVRLFFHANERVPGASFGFGLLSNGGERIFITESWESGKTFDLEPGDGSIDCLIEAPNVVPGTYRFELWISDVPGVQATDHLRIIGEVEVTVGEGHDESVTSLASGVRGVIYVDTAWGTLDTRRYTPIPDA